jgi:hypothetical protein
MRTPEEIAKNIEIFIFSDEFKNSQTKDRDLITYISKATQFNPESKNVKDIYKKVKNLYPHAFKLRRVEEEKTLTVKEIFDRL